MVHLIIHGICGRMGHALVEKILNRTDCCAVGGVDKQGGSVSGIPVYAHFSDLPHITNPVVIDFSSADGALSCAEWCADNHVPCVICSTGLSADAESELIRVSKAVPVFRSANMSVGIYVLTELAKQAAALCGADFDVEIIEKHHRNKQDAPSGTALMIARAINEEADGRYRYVYARHDANRKRDDAELGISSVRGGGIVGEHEVLFCGPEETITISHSAQSRAVFADGALRAALFIAGRQPGLYTMKDLLHDPLSTQS